MNEGNKDGLTGLGVGAAGMAMVAAIVGLARGDLGNDPLRPALHPEAQVSPDDLADEIAKNPKLQERWKLMREFVAKTDEKVEKNLEQAAGGSQDAAKHWKDRVESSNDTTKRSGGGRGSRHGGGGGLQQAGGT